jgi:hypothetical protein
MDWLAAHKAQNRRKIRVSLGATRVRVMFAKDNDMVLWKERSQGAVKGK